MKTPPKWMLNYGEIKSIGSHHLNLWTCENLVNEDDWYTDGISLLMHPSKLSFLSGRKSEGLE